MTNRDLSSYRTGSTVNSMKRITIILFAVVVVAGFAVYSLDGWGGQWKTDFTKHSIDMKEIRSGGPPKDGISSIDNPEFIAVAKAQTLTDTMPVLGLVMKGEAKAYPLDILMRHEIVNDTIADIPVTVTFCPLCNAAIVFDRRLDGMVLDFGTTGNLRKSDMVMYDRQTESWWQQFLGEAIVGELTGKRLEVFPARLESWAKFKARAPNGMVLAPPGGRPYGVNPYRNYDSSRRPFLYNGEMPENIAPLARVVSLEDRSQAWSLDLLRSKRQVVLEDGTILTWEAGQNSALDTWDISEGRDVGNITVQKKTSSGPVDQFYSIDFAFAFHAFYPEAPIHVE